MTHIQVRGAHAHNLHDLDVALPLRGITLLRGPSGSGKSSFALGVLHAESRRRLLETLREPGSASGALPPAPVGSIAPLPPTIAVTADSDARPRRALLDLCDLGGILRGWFARHGRIRCPISGRLLRAWTRTDVADELGELPPGTRLTIFAPLPSPEEPSRLLAELRRAGFTRVRLGRRLVRLDDVERLRPGIDIALVIDRIRWRPEQVARLHEALDAAWKAGSGRAEVAVEGEDEARRYSAQPTSPDGRVWPRLQDWHFDASHPAGQCPRCKGEGCDECGHSGLSEPGRWGEVDGARWADILACPSTRLAEAAGGRVRTAVAPWVDALKAVGLGHLPLGRPVRALGSGEWARLLLARVLPLAQPPRLLILDEPLSTCSAAQASQVCGALRAVADRGVGVAVISHRPELRALADLELVFGPGSGPDGGRLLSAGPPVVDRPRSAAQVRVDSQPPLWVAAHPWAGSHCLRVPRTGWTAVTGPSGSGTTALAVHALAAHFAGRPLPAGAVVEGPEPRLIEREPVGIRATARACVATSAKLWSTVRELLTQTRTARTRGLKADAFTFNRATGWCPACEGRGEHEISLGALAPMWRPCRTCGGGRLRPDVTDIRWRGHSAQDLLTANLSQALELFANHPKLGPRLRALCAVGLGHLPLGRRTSSLSSGERRRFGVALAIHRLGLSTRDPRPTLVVLDRPDAGLDDATAESVADWLESSSRGEVALVTVTHHPALLRRADRVVVLDSSRTQGD